MLRGEGGISRPVRALPRGAEPSRAELPAHFLTLRSGDSASPPAPRGARRVPGQGAAHPAAPQVPGLAGEAAASPTSQRKKLQALSCKAAPTYFDPDALKDPQPLFLHRHGALRPAPSPASQTQPAAVAGARRASDSVRCGAYRAPAARGRGEQRAPPRPPGSTFPAAAVSLVSGRPASPLIGSVARGASP